MDVTLENCHRLLKPGGKLVLGEVTRPAEYLGLIYGTLPGWWLSEDGRVGGPLMSQSEWNRRLVDARFSGVDIAVQDTQIARNHVLSMMVSTKIQDSICPFQKVVIVKSTNSSSGAQALGNSILQRLTDVGFEAVLMDLDETTAPGEAGNAYCFDKFVVSLLEIEAPLLSVLSEKCFQQLKEITLRSIGLLWVTCDDAGSNAGNPHLRTISGLLRTARSESPQLRLHELHLSGASHPELGSLMEPIVRTFESISSDNASILENEIAEQDHRLKIPRLLDEKHKNREMHALGANPKHELQPFIQDGRPLVLTVGTPGMWDTLHFVDDAAHLPLLRESEVEVQVQANGLNFE